MFKKLLFVFPLVISTYIFAQDGDNASDVEEVVTVGSQIKGAKITGSLPVTVLSADDIEATGAVDGDELVENLVEQGLNFFNEQEQTSGGVNASRGDVGAFNLRDIGTGNTLTLLNGRRLITSPGYQTEPILGGSMPVMTVNSNAIPVYGAERIEILRDHGPLSAMGPSAAETPGTSDRDTQSSASPLYLPAAPGMTAS